MIKRMSFRRDEEGVTAVEFAFVAPIFLLLLFGIMQLCIWVLSGVSLQHAAELAARCGAVKSTACGCTSAGCTVMGVKRYAAGQVPAFEVDASAFTVAGIGVADPTCPGVLVTGSYTPFSFTAGLGLPTYTAQAKACYPGPLVPAAMMPS